MLARFATARGAVASSLSTSTAMLASARAAGVAASAAPRLRLAPAATGLAARTYKVTTRRRRKELAHERAVATRHLLEFAKQFDPVRTARLGLGQTMGRLGWEVNTNEMISDGLFVDFSMRDQFVAFEMVAAEHYVAPGSPNASTVPAVAGVPTTPDGFLQLPSESPFPQAPAPWENPVRGMVLDKVTAERHALIRSKGWALVAVPEPLWAVAASAPKNQHYCRRDLLLSLVLPQAPFEPRPVTANAAGASESKKKAAATRAKVEATVASAAKGADAATA